MPALPEFVWTTLIYDTEGVGERGDVPSVMLWTNERFAREHCTRTLRALLSDVHRGPPPASDTRHASRAAYADAAVLDFLVDWRERLGADFEADGVVVIARPRPLWLLMPDGDIASLRVTRQNRRMQRVRERAMRSPVTIPSAIPSATPSTTPTPTP